MIWQRVLSRTNLSLDDNFFEAGGDSLKAVQLVASIKKELNLNISIVDIFESPTIQLLAQKFKSKGQIKTESPESGIERGSRRRNLRINRKR
jgi:acyl carrier protein